MRMDSPMPNDCFHHQPLDLTENSFRLLDIGGISKEGFVDCTIGIYNCDEKILDYQALSCAWGPEQPTGWILLNGRPFRVRQNLLLFLKAAVSSHPVACTRIWIDAICIDQENTPEKTHQVMQMAGIYRNAKTVFVWLGQSKGDYKELRNAITRMENSPIRDGPHGVVSGIKPELYAEDHPISHQAQDLLMRDYWKRMWIIQEIIIAGVRATLLCGEYSFRWYPIQELVKMCDNCWEQDRIGIAMRLIQIAHMSTPLPRQTTILQLLQRLDGGGACADLRDKVYALLGLLRDSGNLPPDYSISTECLFFHVLRSATMSSKQSHVTFKDACILKKSLELDFGELSGYLNRKDEQIHMKESIRLGRQPSLLWPCRLSIRFFVWKRVLLHDLEFRFDHDQSIGATAWLLEHTDVLFEFASFGPEDKFRKAMVLREVDPGLFKYIAMAEYRDTKVLNSEVAGRCCAKERWFLYHLPALISADCLAGEDTRIIVSSEVFLVLMKLSELGMSVGDPRVRENDLDFLGIRDGLAITHSTLFVSAKQEESEATRDDDSTRDWDMARLDIPTYEVYDGYSELWCGSSKDRLPT